jgi:hypothetical protein
VYKHMRACGPLFVENWKYVDNSFKVEP